MKEQGLWGYLGEMDEKTARERESAEQSGRTVTVGLRGSRIGSDKDLLDARVQPLLSTYNLTFRWAPAIFQITPGRKKFPLWTCGNL